MSTKNEKRAFPSAEELAERAARENFWPTAESAIGDEVEGSYEGVVEQNYGGKETSAILLKQSDGKEVRVNGNKPTFAELAETAPDPHAMLRATYAEDVPSGKGNPARRVTFEIIGASRVMAEQKAKAKKR